MVRSRCGLHMGSYVQFLGCGGGSLEMLGWLWEGRCGCSRVLGGVVHMWKKRKG